MNVHKFSQWIVLLGLLPLMGSAIGDQQSQGEDPLIGLRGAAAVSVSYADTQHPAGAKIALLQPQLEPGAQAISDQRTPGLMAELLATNLQQRGYQIASDSDQPAVLVGWYLAMDSDISDEELLQRFGVTPGFAGQAQSERFEKGTLVVQAMDASGRKVLWRGVMQGLADLQADSVHQRLRLEYVVTQVMARFPVAGAAAAP